MFNFLSLIPLIKSAYPGLLILAEAFRYGVSKRGNDTWKDRAAGYHVEKATEALFAYAASPVRYSLLADAGLRLIFALCIAATNKPYVPKSETNGSLPVASEPLQAESTGIQDIG